MEVNWQEIVFTSDKMHQISALSAHRFGTSSIAEEASTYVIEQLSADSWSRLQSYSGKSKPDTFLYSVINNLLEEFSRKRFGRTRPPEWLKREGDLWIRIWKMACLERQPSPLIIDYLCTNNQREPGFITSIITTIKARLPWCGCKDQEIPVSHTDAVEENESSMVIESFTLERELDKNAFQESIKLFSELLENLFGPSKLNVDEDSLFNIDWNKVIQHLNLSEEETLIMRMAFEEGIKLNVIAKAMNMPSYQPGRIIKRILKELLIAMEASDIATENIRALLKEVEL